MAGISGVPRRALRLVHTTTETRAWFCSHCGTPHSTSGEEALVPRVCPECALGVMLSARSDIAPHPDDSFLVVDSSLSVQAVSREAERALAMRERDAVNRHITELLIPADAEASGAVSLAEAITGAAASDVEPVSVTVRPAGAFGVRLRARIAACGPPQAALLVLE